MRSICRCIVGMLILCSALLLAGCYRAFPKPSGLVITMPDQSQHLIFPGKEKHVNEAQQG